MPHNVTCHDFFARKIMRKLIFIIYVLILDIDIVIKIPFIIIIFYRIIGYEKFLSLSKIVGGRHLPIIRCLKVVPAARDGSPQV